MKRLLMATAALGLYLLPVSADAARTAEGEKAMAATAHPSASREAARVLRAGGNAVDAFVAAALVLGVVEPYSAGLGGGGFLLHRSPDGKVRAFDFRERAPRRAHREMFLKDGRADAALSKWGGLAVGVPGQPKGLDEIHRKLGKLPRAELAREAERLAREGFEVSPYLREKIALMSQRLAANRASAALWLPDGKVPEIGTKVRQPDLAKAIALFSKEGSAPFYTGDIAKDVALEARAHGGILSEEDLAAYKMFEVEPVAGRYKDWEVFSFPPPSSGGAVLVEMLNLLATRKQLPARNSAAGVHLLAEIMRRAYADRSEWLGDARFVDVPLRRLLSPEFALLRMRDFSEEKARDVGPADAAEMREGDHTTHLSIVGPAGDAVSATLTINLSFGSGITVPGWGIILNNEMDDFTAAPGTPNAFGLFQGERNAIAGGKTPLSSMTPTIALKGGKLRYVLGTPGGSRIISTVFGLFVNVAAFGLSPEAALDAPRIHHQWRPDTLFVEQELLENETLQKKLEAMGHELRPVAPYCNAQAVWIEEGGKLLGLSDERVEGAPAGF